MKCRKCHQEIPDGSRFCLRCGAPQQVSQNTKSRGNGTGSVYKRGATWTAMRVLGYTTDEAGHLHKTTASKGGFRTKKEALEYLPKLFAEERQKRRMTWQQVYTSWQPTHRAGKSTMDCYSAANKWFRPLWPLWLDDIDIDDLQACLDDCQKGRRTRENMKALAGLLYKYAVPRHLARLNLGQYLIVSGESGGEKTALPEDALEAIRAAVETVPGAGYSWHSVTSASAPVSSWRWMRRTTIEKSGRSSAGQKPMPGKTALLRCPQRSSRSLTGWCGTKLLARCSVPRTVHG